MYLDPGSGSVIFQIILVGLLGISVFIKIFWRKFINLFKSTKNVSPNDEEIKKD